MSTHENPGLTEEQIAELMAAMKPPESPKETVEKFPNLRKWIEKLYRTQALTQLGGLQVAPNFQANAIRFDWAMRLIASYASGNVRLKRDKLATLLNVHLKKADVASLEDPIEDFFVAPVVTKDWELRTFQSVWENASLHTEAVFEAFNELPEGEPKDMAIASAHALLRLGDIVAERSGLARFTLGSGVAAQKVKLPSQNRLNAMGEAIKFTWPQIHDLVDDIEFLAPFMIKDEADPSIASQTIGNSLLDFKPLLVNSDGVTLIAPGSITTAARGHLINEAISHGMGRTLQRRLISEQARRVRLSGLVNLTGGPDMPAGNEVVRQLVLEVSKGHFVHFVLSVDGFDTWGDSGFSGMTAHEDEFFNVVFEGARHAKRAAQKGGNFKQGLTILLLGGWGQGRTLSFEIPKDLRGWQFESLQPDEALTLSGLDDARLSDLWRIWTLSRMIAGMGFELQNPSGFLNLFQWWRESDRAFVPEHELDLAPPCLINFGSDRLLAAREEAAKAIDRRAVAFIDGSTRRVMRVDPRSFFKSLEPIYACIDAVETGNLLGVVIGEHCPIWVSREASGPNIDDEYETWRTALRWVKSCLESVDMIAEGADGPPLLLRLEIEWPDGNDLKSPISDEEIRAGLSCDLDLQSRSAKIYISSKWHRGLRREENAAEIEFAGLLLFAIDQINCGTRTRDDCVSSLANHLGTKSHRWRHALMAERTIELLRVHGLIDQRYTPVPLSAAALVKCGSALSVSGTVPGQRIEGENECFEFLKRLRSELLVGLCRSLRQFNRESITLFALNSLHAALAEQRSWEMSARALRTIYGVENDKAASFERRNQVNGSIRACSIITEIAATEAQKEGGFETASIDFEEFQAAALQLFAVSDLIPPMRAGQIKAEISISPTGHILHDHEFGEKALGSSVELLHAKDRLDHSESYSRYYNESEPPSEEPVEAFIAAIECEFGVASETFVSLGRQLVDLALEKKQSAFAIKRSELLGWLHKSHEGSGIDYGKLVDRLTLPNRENWTDYPEGTNERDFDFSRFDRRYSLIGRPIIALTDDDDPSLVVAPGIVERSAMHNVAGASVGGLQGEFWTSKEMRSYVGRAGERVGLEFNEQVAAAVRAQGLNASSSVKPSACLNQKATNELKLLGDIDVLAFSEDGRHAWVIEAKDIKLCRTLAETARRLSDYRGVLLKKGKPDNLLRHLNRVNYVRSHASDLAKRNNLPSVPKVHGLVVVDVPQPMSFVVASKSADARFVLIDALDSVNWAP